MADRAHSTPAPIASLDAYRFLHPSDPLRRRLEAACERLERLAAQIIEQLDLVEGDPDFEPSLGAQARTYDADGRPVLLPLDGELCLGRSESLVQRVEHGSEDLEPSLGSIEHRDQRRWSAQLAVARDSDLEEQCEDEGGACEDEGHDSDREAPDASDLCPWRSGEVDQRNLSAGASFRYFDRGGELF